MRKVEFYRRFLGYFSFGEPFSVVLKLGDHPHLKGTIVDLETTGLDPQSDHIIALGLYYGSRIEVHQLVKPHYDGFRDRCIRLVQGKPRPLYAYFAHFEQDFLGIKDGWVDLGQWGISEWHDSDWPHDTRFRLVDVTTNPHEDDHDIDGGEVPTIWRSWLGNKKRRPRWLASIAWHCYTDLLREAQLAGTAHFTR